MNLSTITSRLSSRQPEIEFALLVTWALLYPAKGDLLYVTLQSLLLAGFSLARLLRARSLAVTPLTRGLAVASLLLLASSLFSAHPGRSLPAAADFMLVGLYWATWPLDRRRLPQLVDILTGLLSAASAVNLLAALLHPGSRQVSVLFANPILQGAASGLAVILLLSRLTRSLRLLPLLLLLVNGAAMLAAGSKAALLGTVLVASIQLLGGHRRWLPWLAALAAIALLVPNPTQRMARDWLTRDPYALNRIDIWKMSLRILRANPVTGIGPEMFWEHARLHNFPQERGPSRFGKIPESPHSDYLKVACETGPAGAFLLGWFLVMLGRRLLSPSQRHQPQTYALLFLLLQAALFNLLFLPLFVFVLLFLIKPLFDEPPAYIWFPAAAKAAWAFLLLLVSFGLYLMPLAADQLLRQAADRPGIVERFDRLNRADRLDFLGERAPLAKARLLAEFARQRRDLEAWQSAMANARTLQRRNRMSAEAWLQQAYLYLDLLAGGTAYPAMEGEIERLLEEAAAIDPRNPFTRLRLAHLYLRFDHPQAAEREARAAVRIEPDFVAALRLLHERFGYMPDQAAFDARLREIAAKRSRLPVQTGTYAAELFRDDERR